jgi:Tfp pilus assembly protein PilX
MTPHRSERGFALVLALTAIMFITALGVGLMLTTSSETIITGFFVTSEASR